LDAYICWFIRFCRIIFAVSRRPYEIKKFSNGEKAKNLIRVSRKIKCFTFLEKFNINLAAFTIEGCFFIAFLTRFLKVGTGSEWGGGYYGFRKGFRIKMVHLVYVFLQFIQKSKTLLLPKHSSGFFIAI